MLKSKGLQLDRVVNVNVPRGDVVKRLTGRRSCPKCQAVFHVEFAPPKREGLCDRCGTALIQRSDDARDTVENRLTVYENQTAPLIDYYRQRGLLSDVNGAGTMAQVQQRMTELLSTHGLA